MLRPERMSKVSVTGSKAVMDDVIERAHDLHLLHVTDYDGRWESFDNGSPLAGGDEASEKLVTVRSLKTILGVTEEDAGPNRIVTDETIDEELEEIRQEANELDDERDEIEAELRDVEERLDAMAPFADLGIDLDLLWGYDSLAVRVGEGDARSVERALADLDGPTEVFAGTDAVAAVADIDEGRLQDALVEAQFAAVEIPEEDGDPADVLAELRHREEQLETKRSTVENRIEDLRYDVGGFLLAAEETLSIEAQKAEAPLSFATTENAFVAEGWLPTDRVSEFEGAIEADVGDSVEIEELEVAAYNRHGHAETRDAVHDDAGGDVTGGAPGEPAATDDAGGPAASADAEEGEPAEATADGGAEVRSDGGVVTMRDDDPPVVQDNPGIAQPFELLTKAVGRPNYSELDPTIILFLTFPLMFGFIIGDVGYGIIYTAIGYYMYAKTDSAAFKNFGIITAAAGITTTFFGVLYGEIFGLHQITEHFWVGLVGLEHAPINKGLSPASSEWAYAWFVVTVLFGVVHMSVAYVFEFVENYSLHGLWDALTESGSWLLALNGLWLFIFSRPPTGTEGGETVFHGPKPGFIYEVFDGGSEAAVSLGFAGIPSPFAVTLPVVELSLPIVGLSLSLGGLSLPLAELVGVAMLAAGAVLLALGPTAELVEIHLVLAHALSYLRIAAVLLAKAGMAFAVNLLFFGAYEHHGEYHFMLNYGPGYVDDHYEGATVLFDGMMHGGPAMLVFGVFVLIVGHLIVLALGVTSSGIQSIRLEFFEFFSKFYEGDGRTYSPFGSERTYTTEE